MHGEVLVRRPADPAHRGGRSRHVAAGCRWAVRCGGCERDPLGSRLALDRRDLRQTARRRSALLPHRGVSRRHPGAGQCRSGHHPGRTGRPAAHRTWRPLRAEHDLALPRPSRHDLKKKRRMPASKNDPTSRPGARHGSKASPTSTPRGWCSLMRRPYQPRWPACEAAPRAGSAAGRPFRMGTGKPSPSPGLCACTA